MSAPLMTPNSAPLALSTHTLTLADGRRLAWLDYGDPQGMPVLLFHGLPGSRYQGHPDRSIAAELGIRIIAPDRPGFGRSDYQPGRTHSHWPEDMTALADHLGLGRFAVLGVSGGGPYAAVCAWKIPQRLLAVGLVSAMGPVAGPEILEGMPRLNRLFLALARRGEWPMHPPARLLSLWARWWPAHYLETTNAYLPAPDLAVYARPEVARLMREDLAEALRPGHRGVVREIYLLVRPWDFQLQEVPLPVHLWHGEQDATVPLSVARVIAASLPHCRTTLLPEEGHFLFLNHWREILITLRREASHREL